MIIIDDRPIRETPFVVVDVETTGLSPFEDRITEIAMMKVQDGELVDEYSTLINPLVSIPYYITELTGIDNLMVQDAPTAREVVPLMSDFLQDAIFTAHNASFDWGFVYHTSRRERGLDLYNPQLCTLRLSRKILTSLLSHSLAHVADFLDVPIPARHRASGDAYATALVLIKFLSYLEKRFAVRTVEELLRFQQAEMVGV